MGQECPLHHNGASLFFFGLSLSLSVSQLNTPHTRQYSLTPTPTPHLTTPSSSTTIRIIYPAVFPTSSSTPSFTPSYNPSILSYIDTIQQLQPLTSSSVYHLHTSHF